MIQEILKEKQKLINHRLAVLLKADRVEHETLYSAMNYSLLAGGKRIRPFLFLTVLDILGVDSGLYIDAACALECVHTYSLIHDDLPAMDNDDYRRGRLTNHKVYGAGMATQAGDGLLTFAFQLLSEQKQIASDIRVELISLLARAAGPEGMVGGQAHDIEAEGKHLTLSELKILDACKTGCLLSAPVSMACAVAGTALKERVLLENFAAHLGLLFQITDDLLDEKGNLVDAGVEANDDNTFVVSTGRNLIKDIRYQICDNEKGGMFEQVMFNPLDCREQKYMILEYQAGVVDPSLAGE